MFFAFSNQQFDENKTELKDGDKYLSLGAGCYLPKSNYQIYVEGIKKINSEYKKEISKSKKLLYCLIHK